MSHVTTAVLVLSASFAAAKPAAATPDTAFPGNEAVRILDGRRAVELPPLTDTARRYVKSGGAHRPPLGNSEVYMIEASAGLMECSVPYFHPSACAPSTLGAVKRPRFWTVRISGAWLHCPSRESSAKCSPVSAGVPAQMSTVE